jgi:hypothetical protein
LNANNQLFESTTPARHGAKLSFWLLCVPAGLAIAALLTGTLAAKLGVALSCALILSWSLLRTPGRDVGWVIAALILSAGGDWFLSNRGGRVAFFVAGIGLFFGAHVGFLRYAWARGEVDKRILGSLLGVYVPYYWLWLRPAIAQPVLAVAVLIYLLISCVVLSVASGLRTPFGVKALFVSGIGFIVFSDTLISLSEFVHWRHANRMILPTYYLAHLCIAASVLKAQQRPENS